MTQHLNRLTTTTNRTYRTAFVALACLGICGCNRGPEGPTTALATGTVKYKGAPVVGAVVVFRPQAPGENALAAETSTGEDGRFSMQTSLGGANYQEGVVPGNYAVEIRKVEPPPDFTGPPRSILPAKYGSIETSGLKATVDPSGENDFTFELTD
jgi:hypothetical protein